MNRLTYKISLFFIFCCIILVSCNSRFHKKDSYRIQKNELYGFIDSTGYEFIKPQYLYAEEFTEEGVALVVLDTLHISEIDSIATLILGKPQNTQKLHIKYGYITQDNKSLFSHPSTATINILPYSSYNYALQDFCLKRSFACGLAVVSDTLSKNCGYINLDGDTVISCKYAYADRFSDDIAVVGKPLFNDGKLDAKEGGKRGFIDKHGNPIGDFIFTSLDRYLNGRSLGVINYVSNEDNEDIDGELVKDKNGNIRIDRSKKRVAKKSRETNSNAYGFNTFLVDKQGHIIGDKLDPSYQYFNFSKDELAVAYPNAIGQFFNLGCRFLKQDGKFIEPIDGTINNVDEIVKEQKSNTVLPQNIKIIEATRFTDGYAAIKIGDKAWIYIDKYCLLHSPLENYQVLENASCFAYGLAPVKLKGKWGYINTDFKFQIECQYDSCCIAERNLCKVYQSNGNIQIISYIDRNNNIVWQNTISEDPLKLGNSNNMKNWRKDLEYTESHHNLWIFLIICISFVVLLVFIYNLKQKEKTQEKPINVNEDPNIPKARTVLSSPKVHSQYHTSQKTNDSVSKAMSSETDNKKSASKVCTRPKEETVTVSPLEALPEKSKYESNHEERLRVKYHAKPSQSNDSYVNITYPKYNCIVFPYRTHQINRRGYCEKSFEYQLERVHVNKVHIVSNANIVLANGARPYEPDIAIVCDGDKNIRIDVEIDEPYSGLTHLPIHYIGCGDNFRDMNLANAGWIVIRFAEKQIHEETQKCIALIYKIIHQLDNSIEIPHQFETEALPSKVKRWTELEAKIMASKDVRENYLNHEFGIDESEEYTSEDITQTSEEKELSALLEKLSALEEHKSKNLDNSSQTYYQDKNIKFYAQEHIYVYKDFLQLTPVSDIVNRFFRDFDDLTWSQRKAQENGVSQRYMLELWDSKGSKSREVGTFLHEQIESYFNERPIDYSYHFQYKGKEIKEDEIVSIQTEWKYFKQFLKEKVITPFRTEWRIYDLNYKIAGTIDLLCKNGTNFDIYDWKRSDKVNSNERIWQYGINGLENVPDTRFYHYCLQQNLYRYILEKNYDIKINKMYLVVLHNSFNSYHQIEVPRMEKEVKIILSLLQKNKQHN